MSKQSTQKSRSKNKTIPKNKPSDYLKKYVGNTPENVRRMREIFKTDVEIYRKFPYLTKGDDRDFHVFYEYIENKHLLDEKNVFPFENSRDYAFLYWFLDEIHPQNWDKMGAGEERERRKFRDGYYLNMSDIIEQYDINKYEGLISTTMFRQMRGIMPKPPLGEKDKNDAAKWRNWKVEYARWKKQEYRLHPELSGSRNDRSAPKELDDSDDEDPLVRNRNILNGTDNLNRENCLSDGKTPTASSDIKDYDKQLEYFRDENNKGCKENAKFKKVRLHVLFSDQLMEQECKDLETEFDANNCPADPKVYEELEDDYKAKMNLYRNKPCGENAGKRLEELEERCKTKKRCYIDNIGKINEKLQKERRQEIYDKLLLNLNSRLKSFQDRDNKECVTKIERSIREFKILNQDLDRSSSGSVSSPSGSVASRPGSSPSGSVSSVVSSLSNESGEEDGGPIDYGPIDFEDLFKDLERYKNTEYKFYLVNKSNPPDRVELGSVNEKNGNGIRFDGRFHRHFDLYFNTKTNQYSVTYPNMMERVPFYNLSDYEIRFEEITRGGKKSRKTKRNNKKRSVSYKRIKTRR